MSRVARAATEVGARFIYVSTDYVFDGASSEPYQPDSPVNPLGVYALEAGWRTGRAPGR